MNFDKNFGKNISRKYIFGKTIRSGLLLLLLSDNIAQKMRFSIKDIFSICGQIRGKLRIWSHLLKKSLVEIFIFCAV